MKRGLKSWRVLGCQFLILLLVSPLHAVDGTQTRQVTSWEFWGAHADVQAENPERQVVRLLRPNNVFLQAMVDSTYTLYMTSPIVLKMFSSVLGCEEEAIREHLGVSGWAAKRISERCRTLAPMADPEQGCNWILPSELGELRKYGPRERQYSMVMTENNQGYYDSWTSSLHKQTYLVMRRDRSRALGLDLAKAIVHEDAIYFDAKQWGCSPEFDEVLRRRGVALGGDYSRLQMCEALNNPLIGQVFAMIRAYRFEREVVRGLARRGFIDASVEDEYRSEGFRFFDQSLQRGELLRFAKEQVEHLQVRASPLVIFSPPFRSAAIQAREERLARGEVTRTTDAQQRELWSLLEDAYRSQQYQDPLFYHLNPRSITIPPHSYFQSLFREVFLNDLLPRHWDVIERSYAQNRDGSRQSLVEFLGEPLLSGLNTYLTQGPRARIISGL